jgi:hypothetical protein
MESAIKGGRELTTAPLPTNADRTVSFSVVAAVVANVDVAVVVGFDLESAYLPSLILRQWDTTSLA